MYTVEYKVKVGFGLLAFGFNTCIVLTFCSSFCRKTKVMVIIDGAMYIDIIVFDPLLKKVA